MPEPMTQQLRTALGERRERLKQDRSAVQFKQNELSLELVEIDNQLRVIDELLFGTAAKATAEQFGQPLELLNPKPGDRAPTAIVLPDKTERPLGQWNRILIEVAQYLKSTDKLKNLALPVKMPGASRVILNDVARHPNNRDFFVPLDLGDGFILETHGNAVNLVRQAKYLIRECGLDSKSFFVVLP